MEEVIKNILERFGNREIKYKDKDMWTFYPDKEYFFDFVDYIKDYGEFDILLDITAVDYLEWTKEKKDRFEMVYHFLSLKYNIRIRVKYTLKKDEKGLTLTSYYKNANWLEREVYDMYGIVFEGHPDMRRILMYDEFKGFPLRKDYPLKKRQPRIKGLNDD